SCAQILTVSPEYTAVSPGDTAIISCTCSSGVHNSDLHWYQQKPEQPPKLLIYGTSNRQPGVPERFSGSASGSGYVADYKLTITGLTQDDAAHYYCQHSASYPLTQ
ncbi:hypothetical protein GDO78_017555, partial [Eleutherodactylus coqui]